MNRRHLLGSIGTLGVGLAVGFAAQEDDERITDLEETVEALDERVTALEEDTDGSSSEKEDSQADEDGESPSSGGDGEWVTVEGVGKAVSDKFDLESETYRVHATLEVNPGTNFLIVELFSPSGDNTLLFNEFADTGADWTLEVTYSARESGEYFVDVSNTQYPWKLEFEPF